MGSLEQYGLVRIRHLLQPAAAYDGWCVNQRPPQVGDVGTLLDILHAASLPDRYVVESSGADGVTVWLGEFVAEELEPLGRYRPNELGGKCQLIPNSSVPIDPEQRRAIILPKLICPEGVS